MMWRKGNRMSCSDGIRAGESVEKDIEQVITALKRGAHLLKYGRRRKPKFCPFRLANDESALIWFSGKEEKHLKLSHVSKIISGQRTPVFQRYPRPEKEYQSFSLICNDRSLDLICKDKEEAEVWFSGLKALISRSYQFKWQAGSSCDGISSGANSPRTCTKKSSPLKSPFVNTEGLQKDSAWKAGIESSNDSPSKNDSEKAFSDGMLYAVPPNGLFPLESTNCHMRGMGVDAFRVSLSSDVTSSSPGSGNDDGDALGDVYIWGEGTGDGFIGGGTHKVKSCCGIEMDSLLPKALESSVVLDVQTIACGGRHAALVTKQGEIFSWGDELKGRLGHGGDFDVSHPKLIDSLTNDKIEHVACGEYHSCAVSISGDLYTWGDDHFGILGHGNEMGQWVPKRVKEPLGGIQVSSISCGPWHTAVVTSAGQLFTFGDGAFGVLGHGDMDSVSKPREVESLKGMRTLSVACGVWHTAAVVEIMVVSSGSNSCLQGKIFTWGDGDKFRLGHGDKESKLVPTCVAALVEPNFCQVACGHSLTVALTTSGQTYAMGSQVYGQLGNPQSDGKLPCCVEGKLAKSFVEEIACGAYHVAVLTSRAEVYTWGKGANGRLGHGDLNDRNSPTLVEALKDMQVKAVACGTNFTAAICPHKWVNGIDQSICSGCRLQFNFKRKRHNCYHCGLVYCNSCSSKKSLMASMAPNPNKSYRVCDKCFIRLKKDLASNSSSHSSMIRGGTMNFRMNAFSSKGEKMNAKSQEQMVRFSSVESFNPLETQFRKRNKIQEFNSSRVTPIPNGGSQLSYNIISKPVNPMTFFSVSVLGSRIISRVTSPISRRVSPLRSNMPTPTLEGLASHKLALDYVTMKNDSHFQEVVQLRAQVDSLTRKAKLQEVELERKTKQLKEAISVAGEETAKCKAAKEVIKSLSAQVMEMAKMLSLGSNRSTDSPLLACVGDSLPDLPSAVGLVNGQPNAHELEQFESNNPRMSNGSSSRSLVQTRLVQAESMNNELKTKESDENEWVENDEPGVYVTLTSLPGGFKSLKRVRFSRKRFSDNQAEQWWIENHTRVYEQYNVSRMVG